VTKLCIKCEKNIYVPDDLGGCKNAENCFIGENHCLQCNEEGKLCQKCEDGYFPDKNGGCSYTDNCEISYEGKCLKCIQDFILAGENFYFGEGLKICKSINSEDLKICDRIDEEKGSCLSCKEGYYLNNGDKKCSKASNCYESSFGICKKCNFGYYLNKKDDKCEKENGVLINCKESVNNQTCDICQDDYYFDEEGKCVSINFCSVSDESGKCQKCKSGYYLTSNGDSCTINENCNYGDKDLGICLSCEEKYDTINNEVKNPTARNKVPKYSSNKNNYMTSKNNNYLNVEKKLKSSESNKYSKFNKIGKSNTLTEDNSIRDKKGINKPSQNTNRIKLKQSQDNKVKIKKEIYNFSKIENKNKKINNTNLSSNFAYNKNASIKRKKLNVIIKQKCNAINIDSTLNNNVNSLINTNNTNIMTETNNNNISFEKMKKEKNLKKTEEKKSYYHRKQKTMSEISFNEIVRVNILNDELNSSSTNKGNDNRIKIKRIEEKNNNNNKKLPVNKVNAKYNIKKHF